MNYVRQYWNEITAGRIIVSKKVKKQYERLISYLDNKTYKFDNGLATRPIEFIERFCHNVKGSDDLIKLALWQKAYISALFGFIHKTGPKKGKRVFTELHLYIAKKQGKSTISACLGLHMLMNEGEPGAEVVSGGYTRIQSKIIYDIAKAIVKKSPYLRRHIKTLATGIYDKKNEENNFIAASKEADNFDGLNTFCFLCDELHNMRDSRVYEIFTRNTLLRDEPITIVTSTMGTVRQAIFDELYEEDENILNGSFENEERLILCYELDSEEEIHNEANWPKANPMLGITLDISVLRKEYKDALNNPRSWSDLLCKNFNVRTTGRVSWLPWEVINNKKTFELKKFKGKYGIGSFDLSKTGDLTAFNVLFWDDVKKEVCCHTMYWIPQKRIKESKKMTERYEKWIRGGYLRVCPGDKIDDHMIVDYAYNEIVMELEVILIYIYYDAWSATYVVNEFEERGFSRKHCLVPVRQGARTLSIPMQEMEHDLNGKVLNYGDNPITKWCLHNVELVKDRNGNYMPDHAEGNPERKIDGASVIMDGYVGLIEHRQEFIDLSR